MRLEYFQYHVNKATQKNNKANYARITQHSCFLDGDENGLKCKKKSILPSWEQEETIYGSQGLVRIDPKKKFVKLLFIAFKKKIIKLRRILLRSDLNNR